MRLREFHKRLEINNVDRSSPYVRAHIADLSNPRPWLVKGPRGGNYIAGGPVTVESSDQVDDAWMRNVTIYQASRTGRYIRPKRHG